MSTTITVNPDGTVIIADAKSITTGLGSLSLNGSVTGSATGRVNGWVNGAANGEAINGTHYVAEPGINDRPDRVKFAYWVPNVSGGLVISKIPQRTKYAPLALLQTPGQN